MIAHRLSTLARCDEYLQLADGRIVSTDPPEGARDATRGAARP